MYLQHLYPRPADLKYGGEAFRFGDRLTMTVSGPVDRLIRDRLKALFHQFTFTAAELTIAEGPAGDGVTAIISPDGRGAAAAKLGAGDDYALSVCPGGAAITADGAPGLMHGFTTFLQMIIPDELKPGREQFHVPGCQVHDRAAMKCRMMHLCVFPETTPLLLKKAIRLAGLTKYTHVIVEFWGTYPYKCLPEMAWKGRAYTDGQVREIVEEIRSFGMEPVPMLNHLGHATQGRASVCKNVLLDQAPRYATYFEPDGWTWCITNPDTRALLAQMRAELVEAFGPGEYFHLGLDEAYSYATCQRCRASTPDKAKLLAGHINDLTEQLKKIGRRPIIWHDELVDGEQFASRIRPGELLEPHLKHVHATEAAADMISKDVVIADWQYWLYVNGSPTAEYFAEKGFELLLCPWDRPENIGNMCNAAKKLHASGVIQTTWNTLEDCLPRIPEAAQMMWDSEIRESAFTAPITEIAALLRKLLSGTISSYEEAGIHENEMVVCYK